MGKLGGHELNYSSDIDVLFVGEGDPQRLDRAARTILGEAGRCFRVDAVLRPEGRAGPLCRSLRAYVRSWDRGDDPWERPALATATHVEGQCVGQEDSGALRVVLGGRRQV